MQAPAPHLRTPPVSQHGRQAAAVGGGVHGSGAAAHRTSAAGRQPGRPVSALAASRSSGSGRAGASVKAYDGKSQERIERGTIRPRSALAKYRETDPVSHDDSMSVASTRMRASSPSESSRPVSSISIRSGAIDENAEGLNDSFVQDDNGGSTVRRYFTKGLTSSDGKSKLFSHFSVVIPGPPEDDRSEYLRVYYSDSFAAEPAPALVPKDEKTVEVEKLSQWLLETVPRTRIDAYPQLILTKDILRRFVSKDLKIISNENEQLRESLDLTSQALGKSMSRVTVLEKKLQKLTEERDQLLQDSDELDELKIKAAQMEAQIEKLESRNGELEQKIEDQKDAFHQKLEDAKAAVKAKTEAAMEKKLEFYKEQSAQAAEKAEAAAQQLEGLRLEHKSALVHIERAKDTQKQLLNEENALEQIKGLPTHACLMVLDGILQDPAVLEEIVDAATEEHLGQWLKRHNLITDGLLDRSKLTELTAKKKWFMFIHLILGGVNDKSRPAPGGLTNTMTILLDFAAHSPEVMHTVNDALSELERKKTLSELLAEKEQEIEELRTKKAEIEVELQSTKKELADANSQLDEMRQMAEEEKEVEVSKETEQEEQRKEVIEKLLTTDKPKRPRVLNVYHIDPRILKGKNVQPQAVGSMLQLIANLYENKASADAVDDRENNRRQPFPEYVRDFLINKFGLKSIALANLQSLILGVKKSTGDDDVGKRIKVFGLVSGIIEHPCWDEDLSNFVLHCLGLLFQIQKIKENMDHGVNKKPVVDPSIVQQATEAGWLKFGFGAFPAPLQDKLISMSQAAGGALKLHDWLECVVDSWLEGSTVVDSDLRKLFSDHDSNGDGVLDMEEFRGMVKAFLGDEDEAIDERGISRLFAEALEESSSMAPGADDLDVMCPEAFVRVARKFRFAQTSAAE